MRRSSYLLILGVALVVGCGDDNTSAVANPNNYQIVPPAAGSVTIRQDLRIDLRDSGLVIVRNGTDTLPGSPSDTTLNNPRLSYYVDNSDIAIVNAYGRLRALKPGTTTVRAVGYDQETTFNVTVTPYTATFVRLSVASGPAGGLLATKLDTGTFYALPAHRESSILEGLITVTNASGTDTVYCTRCAVRAAPNGRVMRLVTLRSLNPALATVSQAGDPFVQRARSNDDPANVDTVGRVTVFDTSSTPVGFVMEVPSDGLADTVYVKFKLRPLDTLQIRPDSADFPPNNIDQIGTQRRIYPNSDTLQGNFQLAGTPQSPTPGTFAVGVTYLFRTQRLPLVGGNTPSSQLLPARSSGNVNVLRANLPIVVWESALPSYLQIQANGNFLANVTGPCAWITAACFAPTRPSLGGVSANTRTQLARDSLVITCLDNGPKLPGIGANGLLAGGFAVAFSGDGTYSVPGCSPAKVINPMPGAFCTSATLNDLSSQCTVWIRATTTDQATGKLLVDRYRINVRR